LLLIFPTIHLLFFLCSRHFDPPCFNFPFSRSPSCRFSRRKRWRRHRPLWLPARSASLQLGEADIPIPISLHPPPSFRIAEIRIPLPSFSFYSLFKL
jgi:hypothetical protein